MKTIKLLLITILVFISIFLIAVRNAASKIIEPWPFTEVKYNYIAHAGGIIDGKTYTDSLEAFEQAVSNGYKLIELDLLKTADNSLIAAHDWSHFKTITDHKGIDLLPIKSAEATSLLIHKKYNVLTLGDITKKLIDNPDVYLVTDKSNDFPLLLKLADQKRLFIEIFGVANYLQALLYGISHPMLNNDVGRLGVYWSKLKILFLNPLYITVSVHTVINYPEYMEWAKERGVKIFIFTVNKDSEFEYLQKKYQAAIYTDILLPK